MLIAALAFVLAFATPRVRQWSLAALLGTLVVSSQFVLLTNWQEVAFLGCWISIVVTAAAVHLPRGPDLIGGVLLAINAGFWSRAVVGVAGTPVDLLSGLVAILIIVPAIWLIGRGASISVKVASSWLIAIAMLAAVLPFLPVTPGYLPDHLE